MLAVYVCSKCGFRFERASLVEQCPACGNINVRHASNAETEAYRKIQDNSKPSDEK